MTKNALKVLDVVALLVDWPELNLWRGQVGTIAELLADGTAFVNFRDRDGFVFESIALLPEQFMVLRYEPVSPDSQPEMVTA